jgi:hypothetical protein
MNSKRKIQNLLILILVLPATICLAQQKSLFKEMAFDSLGVKVYELCTTIEGVTHMTSSVGLWKLKGHQFGGPAVGTGTLYDSKGKPSHQYVKMRNYLAEDSIRSMAQGGPDSVFYFVTSYNFFLFRPNGEFGGWGWPPFNFPKTSPVTKIWIDENGDLFAGTRQDNFFIIKEAAIKKAWIGVEAGGDKDSNYFVTKGGKNVKQIVIQPGIGIYSFAQDATDKNTVWIGTNHGLFTYNKQTGKITSIDKTENTITEIYTGENGNIWFSTLEKGMGIYNLKHSSLQFYPYKKNKTIVTTKFPIKTFCYKSPHQFLVAVMDSLPAIFNTESRTYLFFDDSVFHRMPNETSDVKVDRVGNILIIKGGNFYISNGPKNNLLETSVTPDSSLFAPFFRGIQLLNGEDLATLDYKPELLKKVVLTHDQNSIIVFYDVADFNDKKDIRFAWKMDGYTNGWVEMPAYNFDSAQFAYLQDIKPGKYLLQLKVRIGKEDWRKQQAEMIIIITPPFWQTWWFWTIVISGVGLIVGFIMWWRIRAVKKREREKFAHEKQIMELEAKALRAQMNPHFIFNCLNSIKSLIQQHDEEKSVTYLTTFSKLIRNLFNNADKKEISLYDEIETCKLYLQLEAMRFDTKFSYAVNVDDNIDLKSIQVPALIIQPFIENAIWHGIVPRNSSGHVSLNIRCKDDSIEIVIDDDGIGREASQKNKSVSGIAHQSKGVNLSQSRLELNNLLQQRQANLQIIDKKDEQGTAAGTKIIITLKEEA